jgi:hypothetical protein
MIREPLLLMAPGWVWTDLGGPQARLSIEESIPNLANTMDAQAGKAGLQYLDYLGRKVRSGGPLLELWDPSSAPTP